MKHLFSRNHIPYRFPNWIRFPAAPMVLKSSACRSGKVNHLANQGRKRGVMIRPLLSATVHEVECGRQQLIEPGQTFEGQLIAGTTAYLHATSGGGQNHSNVAHSQGLLSFGIGIQLEKAVACVSKEVTCNKSHEELLLKEGRLYCTGTRALCNPCQCGTSTHLWKTRNLHPL
jgi:hypothetical protein